MVDKKSNDAGMHRSQSSGDFITTTIRIPRAVHQLLRQMAVERAARQGGRVSVSGVLAELALERQDGVQPSR